MQGFVVKAEAWRKRWEACQMEVEDLQASNARAITRRQELVNSYWPVMERLGAAEDVVAALTKQVRGGGMGGGGLGMLKDSSAAAVVWRGTVRRKMMPSHSKSCRCTDTWTASNLCLPYPDVSRA
jgi:hypothetical protein